jgi:hypothetical protein
MGHRQTVGHRTINIMELGHLIISQALQWDPRASIPVYNNTTKFLLSIQR